MMHGCAWSRGTTIVLIIAWCLLPAVDSWAESGPDLPAPTSGPGVVDLKRSQERKVERAWRELIAGNFDESRKRAARAGDAPPARLVEYQIVIQERGLDTLDELLSFCDRHPDYAAAWITLSIAAERAGAEPTAYDAAIRGADLWPDSAWGARPDELHRRWVDDRLADADRLVADGMTDEALAKLDAVEAVELGRQDAALIRARALVADGRTAEAEGILIDLENLPEALFLRGSMAERRGEWQTAMNAYAAIPAGCPDRDAALARAQAQWRLTLLAPYARAAIEADPLTRGDLAVVLVSLQPRLATFPGGSVPVMSDIVDHPGHREIITVVRLGIMSIDHREHRFDPDAPADEATVREAIERTRALVGLPEPVWCDDPVVVGSACTPMASPPNGGLVARAVLEPTSGADR